jgi:hypothetical protein
MTDRNKIHEENDAPEHPSRIAYIKPTAMDEAVRQGIISSDIKLPEGTKLYVLHAIDGSVLGFTDAWDSAYGAAVQNEFTPVSVH